MNETNADRQRRYRERTRAWYELNPEEAKAKKERVADTNAKRQKRYRERMKFWYDFHPEDEKADRGVRRIAGLRMRTVNRDLVLTHYGNGKLACVKCGFDDVRALSLDHINGLNGAAREQILKLRLRLIREGFPGGYQTLCMNCQWIKRHENHEAY